MMQIKQTNLYTQEDSRFVPHHCAEKVFAHLCMGGVNLPRQHLSSVVHTRLKLQGIIPAIQIGKV